MEPFLTGALTGAAVIGFILVSCFKVETKEKWEALQMEVESLGTRRDELMAENAKLRVALVAGEMTEEGKKVAAKTMAALDAILPTERVA